MQTKMIAFQRWCHLNTTVTVDTIEVVLITLVASPKAAIKPKARLNCTRTYNVVALPRKSAISLIVIHGVTLVESLGVNS